MNLCRTPKPGQVCPQEVVPAIDDLMAPPAESDQVVSRVVGGVPVDMVPVQSGNDSAPFAAVWLLEHPVSLSAAAVRRLRLDPRSWTLRDTRLRSRDCFLHMRWSFRASYRVPRTLEPAAHAVSRNVGDGDTASGALAGPTAVLAATLMPARTVRPYGEIGKRLIHAATTAAQHTTSLPRTPAVEWRTRDPGERARALKVEKPPPQLDGQLGMFEELA